MKRILVHGPEPWAPSGCWCMDPGGPRSRLAVSGAATCCGRGGRRLRRECFFVHRVRSADPRACERESVEGFSPGFFGIHEPFRHGLWLDRNRKEGLWSFFGGAEVGLAPLSLSISCAKGVSWPVSQLLVVLQYQARYEPIESDGRDSDAVEGKHGRRFWGLAWLGKRAEAEQPAAEIVDKVGSEVVIIE